MNVNGVMSADKNINAAEALACVKLATKLREAFPDASIGIVTPFRDQKNYLFKALSPEQRENIKVDTVHHH
jgi:superfamily I DNA and/or RNA helicase